MARLHVTLSGEQADAVRRLAAARGVPASEVVRESVDTYMTADRKPDNDETRRRAPAAIGAGRSGRHDIAERHDDYLAETGPSPPETCLGSAPSAGTAEIRRRAIEAAGALRGGPPDLAVNHDKYLAEAFEE